MWQERLAELMEWVWVPQGANERGYWWVSGGEAIQFIDYATYAKVAAKVLELDIVPPDPKTYSATDVLRMASEDPAVLLERLIESVVKGDTDDT